jgi:protein tyrosine phosphatase (PTP) superfamily phosphohydrolase (DUF442 family)
MAGSETPRRRRRWVIALAAIVVLGGVGYWYRDYLRAVLSPPSPPPLPTAEEKARWAKPMTAEPLENCYRIDDNLYRGAQPDAGGMRKLKEMGIKTVINLRLAHDDADEIGELDLDSVRIRIDTLKPKLDALVEFLHVATDPNRQPVFVHCHRGIDRTGIAVAVYRVVVCGWTKIEALKEMFHGPFGYDHLFPNVPAFLDRLDFDDLRRRLEERNQTAETQSRGEGP